MAAEQLAKLLLKQTLFRKLFKKPKSKLSRLTENVKSIY